MRAVARGLLRHGIDATISDSADASGTDFVATWGMSYALPADRPRLVIEAGYLNGVSGDYVPDRLRFLSVGWNGMHGRADAFPMNCPPDRWNRLPETLKPWKSGGEYVLVCGQHPGDTQAPLTAIWDGICADVAQRFDTVVYRAHPLIDRSTGPLREWLAGAAVCVTWASSAAVEAVIEGVPTITLDAGSIAWPVTSHRLDDPLYTGTREQWASDLAYRQWTPAEIEAGEMWDIFAKGVHA